jgi:hypothetical protein
VHVVFRLAVAAVDVTDWHVLPAQKGANTQTMQALLHVSLSRTCAFGKETKGAELTAWKMTYSLPNTIIQDAVSKACFDFYFFYKTILWINFQEKSIDMISIFFKLNNLKFTPSP